MTETTNFLNRFSNTYYDNTSGVRYYILKIIQNATRLEEVNIPMSDDFIVHRVLDSLQMELEQLNISYMPSEGRLIEP